MKTKITFLTPPSYDFFNPEADPEALSLKDYSKEYIHRIDLLNSITYFYPSTHNLFEGYIFKGSYPVEKVLEKLPEEFKRTEHHKKFIR